MENATVVISVPETERDEGSVVADGKNKEFSLLPTIFDGIREKMQKLEKRKTSHSIKVGVAMVMVSLLYLLDPLYNQVGDNAMWAIMTVVIVLEFFAGATLCKGLNRGLGTVLGGGLGCLAAALAQQVGGIGNSIVIGSFVFLFGAIVTYCRQVKRIKLNHDYGAMVFILTFNLIAVSGLRAEKVMELARERVSTIGIGFGVCIFTSLLVFPNWAGDELHNSIANNFLTLAHSLEECLGEYFGDTRVKDDISLTIFIDCRSILDSKAKDETMANFAKWEPWHGRFGIYYPWKKYLAIGKLLREVATTTLSLQSCLQSQRQPSTAMRELVKEPSEAVGSSLVWTLKELGNSIMKMRKCQVGEVMVPMLKTMKQDVSSAMANCSSDLELLDNNGRFAIASFVFLILEIVDKVEELAKEVKELGEAANFIQEFTDDNRKINF